MPQNEALNTLSRKLKTSVAAARAATKTKKQKTDSQEALAVQKVLDAVDIPKQIRAGSDKIRVMQLGEGDVRSSFFSAGPLSEHTHERAQRIATELTKCNATDLTGTAAHVFKTCKDADLHPSIEVFFEYETDIPYIVVHP